MANFKRIMKVRYIEMLKTISFAARKYAVTYYHIGKFQKMRNLSKENLKIEKTSTVFLVFNCSIKTHSLKNGHKNYGKLQKTSIKVDRRQSKTDRKTRKMPKMKDHTILGSKTHKKRHIKLELSPYQVPYY